MDFISFGDWGENTELKHQLTYIVHTIKPDALITLGDNFYPNGVESKNDPSWDSYELYFGTLLTYAVLGNHDYKLNPQAQFIYRNPNWVMPYHYYDRMYKDVHLIALDTIDLAPQISSMFIPHLQLQPSNQLEWLKHVLKVSTSSWIIVFGHYPVFSNGGHGDTEELKQKLLPLFKNKVHLYLSGHDHSICHKQYNNTHYVVSGNGSYSNPVNHRPGFTPLKENTGFTRIYVDHATLRFRLCSMNGTILLDKILKH